MCIKDADLQHLPGAPRAQLKRLAAALQEADAVLVGAGAGLSTSAGFDLQRGAVPPLLWGL